jgi:mRNA interferase MazF
MICDAFEVVAVPFPFTDSAHSVRRPAVILSRHDFNAAGHTLMAMVTDSRNLPWPLDVPIDYASVGLRMASVVRMKLFTLDNRLIIRRLGALLETDRQRVLKSLQQLLPGSQGRPD